MDKLAFNITLICYLAASLSFFLYLIYRRPIVSNVAGIIVGAGLLFHTIVMGLRASVTGHGPYTTSFEVAVFLSWLVIVVYFLIHWRYKIKDLGSFVIPLAFLILLYAAFLSSEALKAPESEFRVWLTLHRTLSVLGYAAFAMAFAAGVMYLIQEQQVKSKKFGIMYFRMPSLEMLDNLNSKVITVGFPLFTLGFMTGAIWNAQMNDLSLFSWDLLKTWPLVLGWFLYGVVFFGRFLAGIRGKRAAQGSIIGFATVIITFFLHI